MQSISQPIADILELSRWAPSGDNEQPWRFEIVDEHHLIIHASIKGGHGVYDLDGCSSQIALGALLETLTIAANKHGMRTSYSSGTHSDYFVELIEDMQIQPDPLWEYIQKRSVQRRTLQRTPLTDEQKQILQNSVGEFYTLRWFEGGVRWDFAKLMYNNAKLRLTLPEAYLVHRDIIQWNARFSDDRVPDQALGLDKMTLKLMRWVMTSWQRVNFFNTYLLGHLIPRIEMDLLPGLFCAAHFAITSDKAPESIDDYIKAGRAIQRFWLTATSLELQLQPEMTPLIFSRYVRQGRTFSELPCAVDTATKLANSLSGILQHELVENTVFLGRIGNGAAATSRSKRLSIKKLVRVSSESQQTY
tara:strand:- start:194 stop:1276 length:1083 start_codon:yes stop_codon:yes gene_type:complete